MIPNKFRVVYIEWLDASSDKAWDNRSEIDSWSKKKCKIYELGWIVADTKKHIVIGSQLSNDGDIGNRTKIPKKMIVKFKYLNIKCIKKIKGGLNN